MICNGTFVALGVLYIRHICECHRPGRSGVGAVQYERGSGVGQPL